MAIPLIQVSRLQMDMISCKLCSKIYENPRILNCLHSFCATCLQLQISPHNCAENRLLCPLCKESTYVKDGVENLPHNTMLARFIAQAKHEELLLVCDRVISEHIHDLEKERSQFEQGVKVSHSHETEHQSGNDVDQSKCVENQSENNLDESKCAENQSENNLDQSKSAENQSVVYTENTEDSNSCLGGDFQSNSFLSDSFGIQDSEERSNRTPVFTWNASPLVSLVENTEKDILRNQEMKMSLEAMKMRENVKTLVTNLQENALGVVYALESINLCYHEWLDNREHVKNSIKERSMHLQKLIKSQERKLLSTLEDNTTESNRKQEMTNSKDLLQGVLRGTLNTTEFLKLLTEFGNVTDFLMLQDIIKARASHLSNPNIQLRRQKFTFKLPLKDADNFIEEAFGELKEESSVQNIELNTKQTTNCEDMANSASAAAADDDAEYFPLPLSHQLQAQYYDESYGYSHYGLQYITLGDSSNLPTSDDSGTKSNSEKSSDATSDHKYKTTVPRSRRRMSFNDISSRVQNIASKKRPTRRISVPANTGDITSNISRRRLCALSLLTRSKSQEEGTPSELETSANIAQLEWIRENVRKKTLSRQSSQPES